MDDEDRLVSYPFSEVSCLRGVFFVLFYVLFRWRIFADEQDKKADYTKLHGVDPGNGHGAIPESPHFLFRGANNKGFEGGNTDQPQTRRRGRAGVVGVTRRRVTASLRRGGDVAERRYGPFVFQSKEEQ